MATSRLCSIPDCDKPHYGFGWCRRHYHRNKTYGDPNAGCAFRGAPMQWLFSNTTHEDRDDCLIWPFARGSKGYGSVKFRGRTMGAHRAMCILAHGEPPSDGRWDAAHSCGNGNIACVNPNHLRWATMAENAADTAKHGSLRGTKQCKCRLSENDVRRIRAMRGTMSAREIGRVFEISRTAVNSIHHRRNWGWLG
jgi:hypothetical protein